MPFEPERLPTTGTPRQRLAAWVTHRDNRAFARGGQPRWAILFSRPLVEPIDNLSAGTMMHRALDILADDFAAHGYDWHRLLSTIAATRVFQLDSKCEPRDEAIPDDTARREASWAIFPLARLRPEQVVGALLQSASLPTIDASSHILVRLARQIGKRDFIARYGDSGADEFDAHGGTIPQRLLMMNGRIVEDRTSDNLLFHAATQIAVLAPDDEKAIETAVLAVLTRRPTPDERQYFRGPARRHARKPAQPAPWAICIGHCSTAPSSHGTIDPQSTLV